MDSTHQRPSEEEIRIFSERIAGRLAEQPLELDPTAHREEVAGVLRKFGDATHYELLGIAPTASAMEVHAAFEAVGRLVHPANAPRLGLTGKEALLELLFESVTQAYLCLSSPERRKPYDRELGPSAWTAAVPSSRSREVEAREMARRYFERAVAMVDAEEFFPAIELIEQAVRNDPRGEYYAMLGRLEAKNPLWLRRAAASLRRAVELGAGDPGLRSALAEVEERLRAADANAASTSAAAPREKRSKGKKREVPEVEVVPEEDGEVEVPLPDPGGRGRGRTRQQ
jgi:curved DNA-binding protein CbpA